MASALQLEELRTVLCALASLSTQRGDNRLSTGQCCTCTGAPELGCLQSLGTGGGGCAFWRGKENPAFPLGADEDSMEWSGLPVTWEVSRNAGGVRRLEWEGADKGCRTAQEEREAAWEALLPCQGQGNCGGLQLSAWRWDCEPQPFFAFFTPKKRFGVIFFFPWNPHFSVNRT